MKIKAPLYEHMLEQGMFDFFDLKLIEELLQDRTSENLLFFLSTFFKTVRAGHLCMICMPHSPFTVPSLKDLKKEELDPFLKKEEWRGVEEKIYLGFQELPADLYSTDLDFDEKKPFVIWKDRIYLQRLWKEETSFLNEFLNKLKEPSFSEEHIVISDPLLLEEQKIAVERALKENIFLLSGGPGTGKTYTAAAFIRAFIQSTPKDKKLSLVLTAPTGKATSHLYHTFQKAFQDISSSCFVENKTLHSLLNKPLHNFLKVEECLPYDLLLVDEASMIDITLMRLLITSLKPSAKLILIGDPYQLPSIEAGSLFKNMLDIISDQFPLKTFHLSIPLRSDIQPILDLANLVKQGEDLQVLSFLSKQSNSPITYYDTTHMDTSFFFSLLKKIALEEFTYFYAEKPSLDVLLEKSNQFKILSPLNKGPFGIEALNDYLEAFLKESYPLNIAPLIINQNNPHLELYNGEIGLLLEDHYVYFSKKNRKGEDPLLPYYKVPLILISSYSRAFAISIHKSQGSECGHALIILPKGTPIFGKEAFYTAITRAKKKITLFADKETLSQMIRKTDLRQSSLYLRATENTEVSF